MLAIGYAMAIPEKREAFFDASTRARWREEKQMIVLKLWSDQHHRTPVDVFTYEPFSVADELAHAVFFEVAPNVLAPFESQPTFLDMKRAAGRPQDLIDVEELGRAR